MGKDSRDKADRQERKSFPDPVSHDVVEGSAGSEEAGGSHGGKAGKGDESE